MLALPRLLQLKNSNDLRAFSQQYAACSGLPIPDDYLFAATSRVFGFYLRNQLIGGFILGSGEELRTITLFAQPENQAEVYNKIGSNQPYTEICCLWIAHAYRKNTWINTCNWISLAAAVNKYALPNILFGTCSAGLARLYATSKKAKMVSRDRVNRRRTYVFRAEKRHSLVGFANIIIAKLQKRFGGRGKTQVSGLMMRIFGRKNGSEVYKA